MIGYVILVSGITALALASFIFGGAWCAARGRDVGRQPKETPRRATYRVGEWVDDGAGGVFVDGADAVAVEDRMQDAEDVNGRVDTGCCPEEEEDVRLQGRFSAEAYEQLFNRPPE